METHEETHLIEMEATDNSNDHPLKGTMQWFVEEKSDEHELVYVVDVDKSKPSYNNQPNVIVVKADQSYKRVPIKNLRATTDIDQTEQWKLRNALFFAAERSRESTIVAGSVLAEQYIKTVDTASGFWCFKTTQSHNQKALKGYKVMSYEWDGSKLNGFHTQQIGDKLKQSQFASKSDNYTVINPKNINNAKLREMQNKIEDKEQIIIDKETIVADKQVEIENLKQKIKNLQTNSETQRRNSVNQIDILQKSIQNANTEHIKIQNELNSQNQTVQHLYDTLQQDYDSKIEQLQTITKQKNQLQNLYDKLQQDYDSKMERLKIVTKQRNQYQDKLVDYSGNVTTLDATFPAAQDIVSKLDETRGQSRLNCAKKCRAYFKSRNKDFHKLNINKQANVALFETLMTCYQKMKIYHDSITDNYKATIKIENDDNFSKVCYHNLRKDFTVLYDKVEKQYVSDILDDITRKYDGMLEYCTKELWTRYMDECLYICWYIVVSQSPKLKLYPLECDQVDQKETDDMKQNDETFVAVYGSEDEESLNYYVWPCIIREDNNYQLSKMHALFLNEMPIYKKKALKRMQAQSNTENNGHNV